MTTDAIETRVNAVASFHLFVKAESDELPMKDEDLIAEAFEAAHEEAKRVLSDRPDLIVEAEY